MPEESVVPAAAGEKVLRVPLAVTTTFQAGTGLSYASLSSTRRVAEPAPASEPAEAGVTVSVECGELAGTAELEAALVAGPPQAAQRVSPANKTKVFRCPGVIVPPP